ncbi:MAG: pyridoxine 5'-phosphate synthase [Saprospiraceae bacterium]|nr:pyridoxine 5'-phosphate synthase [Saprospiraceae bacterium]
MTRLSVNINKIALIRNSRGSNYPDLVQVAMDCEEFGAQGITVHPRPDQRHIRYSDIPALKDVVSTEFNIEGYPSEDFLDLVIKNKPHQCTLVPDEPGALTSDCGWDTITHKEKLKIVIARLHDAGIRVSLFIDPIADRLHAAKETGTDRIEFYTGSFAQDYGDHKQDAVDPFRYAAKICHELELGINAGHDLNLENLSFFKANVPELLEVSIGHAIVCDALYFGLKNTIQMYLKALT